MNLLLLLGSILIAIFIALLGPKPEKKEIFFNKPSNTIIMDKKNLISEIKELGFIVHNDHLGTKERAENPLETDYISMVQGRYRLLVSPACNILISIHDKPTNRYIVLKETDCIKHLVSFLDLIEPNVEEYPFPEPVRDLSLGEVFSRMNQ